MGMYTSTVNVLFAHVLVFEDVFCELSYSQGFLELEWGKGAWEENDAAAKPARRDLREEHS